ncbi:hypothetical protein ATE84_2785 [Aquimarina sp. MAR_2010_214]|uniref:hypothetical protein n=1 Tax=Aquimarina sp. MAR_2010_214 TaxID=1250026 RepID=UPI000CB5D717|nr:hypothetical protein [Aquimarina sp. MAR_2010_214]PKV50719.1 hypothetical protein ATE84_2785 [Aquimarina sp. MAR_2010_214]
MKRLAVLLLFLFVSTLQAQHMDNDKLELIIKQNADTLNGIPGNWKFIYKETPMLCVTDETNNRMRIISPITASDNLDKDVLLDAMTANFHSALDVKYAITNKILWSVYIHPLKELTEEQVNSAISQVYYAAKTFGSTFSSTELIFGTGNAKGKSKEVIPEEKTREF